MLSICSVPKTDREVEKLMKHPELFKKGIKRGAMKAGRAVQKRAITMLSTGSRTGRKYANLPHRSSAPGEVPRSQSGRLVRSIYYHSSSVDIRIGATEKHGLFLEKGTKFMSARPHEDLPWLRLAMELEDRNVEKLLQDGVKEQLC